MGRRERVQLDEIVRALEHLDRKSELIQTVLMVREPESVTAASAYEGLRKQIVAVAGERWAHLARLAQIDHALHHSDNIDTVRRVSAEWLEQAGVMKLHAVPDGTHVEDLFEILDDSGDTMQVVQPAYVDPQSGRTLKMGRVQFVNGATSVHADRVSARASDGTDPYHHERQG